MSFGAYDVVPFVCAANDSSITKGILIYPTAILRYISIKNLSRRDIRRWFRRRRRSITVKP